MLNTVKSVLADISSISPRLCSDSKLHSVPDGLSVVWFNFYTCNKTTVFTLFQSGVFFPELVIETVTIRFVYGCVLVCYRCVWCMCNDMKN